MSKYHENLVQHTNTNEKVVNSTKFENGQWALQYHTCDYHYWWIQ